MDKLDSTFFHDVMNFLSIGSGQLRILTIMAEKSLPPEEFSKLQPYAQKSEKALKNAVELFRAYREKLEEEAEK